MSLHPSHDVPQVVPGEALQIQGWESAGEAKGPWRVAMVCGAQAEVAGPEARAAGGGESGSVHIQVGGTAQVVGGAGLGHVLLSVQFPRNKPLSRRGSQVALWTFKPQTAFHYRQKSAPQDKG